MCRGQKVAKAKMALKNLKAKQLQTKRPLGDQETGQLWPLLKYFQFFSQNLYLFYVGKSNAIFLYFRKLFIRAIDYCILMVLIARFFTFGSFVSLILVMVKCSEPEIMTAPTLKLVENHNTSTGNSFGYWYLPKKMLTLYWGHMFDTQICFFYFIFIGSILISFEYLNG